VEFVLLTEWTQDAAVGAADVEHLQATGKTGKELSHLVDARAGRVVRIAATTGAESILQLGRLHERRAANAPAFRWARREVRIIANQTALNRKGRGVGVMQAAGIDKQKPRLAGRWGATREAHTKRDASPPARLWHDVLASRCPRCLVTAPLVCGWRGVSPPRMHPVDTLRKTRLPAPRPNSRLAEATARLLSNGGLKSRR
jgi:hypothetical protein